MTDMAAKPDSRYTESNHREAQRKLMASMRRVNRARARRARATTPAEVREWNRSVRADEHDAARALRAYLEAEAVRPVLVVN